MLAILFGTVLPWLFVGAGIWLGHQLVRQNGRVLLRLEAIEKRLSPRVEGKPQEARGLPVGTIAPDFELPDLTGARHRLSEFRGNDLLLIFFNPKCGFCTKMADDLGALPLDDENGRAIPIVVTTGAREDNLQLVGRHGIRGTVLLQKEMEVAAQFHAQGTPMGYRIDKEGRIASELTIGAEALLKLAERAPETAPVNRNGSGTSANGSAKLQDKDYRSLAASRLNRKGLKAGETAPEFRLPRIDGGELSLADLRGGRILLVFSDPHCGPCAELAPRLQEIHQERADLSVLVISRGDAEENRAKAADLDLTFPIVLQEKWEVSLKYAMFATPIGYLIDEAGVLASDVAVGIEPILALANEPVAVGVPASAGEWEFRL
ncbi:MAG TPA: redoxin domain-containing protein [Gemmataceae bacterium]|nr:redoxin domain-containing protein [Gemmataceae bacterium]